MTTTAENNYKKRCETTTGCNMTTKGVKWPQKDAKRLQRHKITTKIGAKWPQDAIWPQKGVKRPQRDSNRLQRHNITIRIGVKQPQDAIWPQKKVENDYEVTKQPQKGVKLQQKKMQKDQNNHKDIAVSGGLAPIYYVHAYCAIGTTPFQCWESQMQHPHTWVGHEHLSETQ